MLVILRLHDSSMFCQYIIGCFKSCSELPCSGITPTLKIASSMKFIFYRSCIKPSIKVINLIKFGPQITPIDLQLQIVFMPFHLIFLKYNKTKGVFFWLSSDWWIGVLYLIDMFSKRIYSNKTLTSISKIPHIFHQVICYSLKSGLS
jgi:hypothetical protein